MGRGKDGVLAAIGDHLICHRFGSNRVGNDSAAECGQHLIDDITDGQSLRIAVAHLPQQQLDVYKRQWDSRLQVTSRGYMLGYTDLKDSSVSGFFRFLAKVGDNGMKMQIVKIGF